MADEKLMKVKLSSVFITYFVIDSISSSPSFALLGRDRYLNKYIYVKKGGIGGIAMILTGYVVLSYVWEYDHISKTFSFIVCCSSIY